MRKRILKKRRVRKLPRKSFRPIKRLKYGRRLYACKAKRCRRKSNPPIDRLGWVNPNGRFFKLNKNKILKMYENHDLTAKSLLSKFYPEWKWQDDFRLYGAPYASKALEFKGWIRVAGEEQYSTWSIKDPFTGRMRRNLADLIAGLSRGKVYVDTFEGPTIGGEYIDDIFDRYQ